MGVRENKVERYLHNEIVKLGGTTRKFVSPSHSGVPDRIVIIYGWVIFVEIKTVDGRLSTAQQREHGRLMEAGASVRTLYGVDEVDDFVNNLRKTDA